MNVHSFNSDALIPVTKVQLGEHVTFTCSFPDLEYSSTRVKWYKQSFGDTLKLITTVTEKPTFEQGFPSSRFHATFTTTMSTLTIRKTIQEDEAMYHCGVTTWSTDHWSGTYLSLKGNTCSSNPNLKTFERIPTPLLILCCSNFIIGQIKKKKKPEKMDHYVNGK